MYPKTCSGCGKVEMLSRRPRGGEGLCSGCRSAKCRARGIVIPEGPRVEWGTYGPEALRERLDALARERGVSRSRITVLAIRIGIANMEKNHATHSE